MEVAVIGAGAAGCFCAIETKRLHPDWDVTVFEAGSKALAKVAVTGGGRCNLTNSFERISDLREAYPRGWKLLRRVFNAFGPEETYRWWKAHGVRLVTQEDCCVFPASQDAMQIVRTLERLMSANGVKLECGKRLERIGRDLSLHFTDASVFKADRVVLCIGGTQSARLEAMLPEGIAAVPTVPSLFTFVIKDESLRSLMGAVTGNATVGIAGTKYNAAGPLLITDWGMSGPAILKLSSYAARYLADNGYLCELNVNWLSETVRDYQDKLASIMKANQGKMIAGTAPEGLTSRLWKHLVTRAGIREDMRWNEAGSRSINKMVNVLCCDTYKMEGRAKFKDEFVTCGGVDLHDINPSTMESRSCPGLFFAGEVTDIDAITGGFNLQAAWSTGITAARNLARESEITKELLNYHH